MDFIHEMDLAVINFMQEVIRSEFLDSMFTFFTKSGDNGIIWIVSGIILSIPKRTRKAGLMLLFSLTFSFISSELIIKNAVHRVRPFIENPDINLIIDAPVGYSFPSSHATTAFASAIALIMNYRFIGSIALITAVFISLSRIYLCVHYTTDVLCGAVIGIVSAIFTYFIFRLIYRNNENKKNLQYIPESE